jgi:hypothetical protein
MTLITDGALNYAEAFKKEYRSLKGPRSLHIPHVRFDGDRNNNKMERMNGEIRDRERSCEVSRYLTLLFCPAIESITTS